MALLCSIIGSNNLFKDHGTFQIVNRTSSLKKSVFVKNTEMRRVRAVVDWCSTDKEWLPWLIPGSRVNTFPLKCFTHNFIHCVKTLEKQVILQVHKDNGLPLN